MLRDITNRPFENLDRLIPETYKKAREKALRLRNKNAKQAAPGASRMAIARNVLAWREKNTARLANG